MATEVDEFDQKPLLVPGFNLFLVDRVKQLIRKNTFAHQNYRTQRDWNFDICTSTPKTQCCCLMLPRLNLNPSLQDTLTPLAQAHRPQPSQPSSSSTWTWYST
jgi:hypothetical protein